ncbi:pyrroline-5-carboxylate reductase [Luteibacter sp. PPL201]|jgi:pyrroline-5-carboxylate reductase|uniref:Pyrroline-5-carboxylate reductase n=1 Tax=Luteibacter sahnii TaxID=3021977 RepID=A0ABT6BAN0_9GAMM|nr:pyrroline-5-carboxylate reductase [Luteibacter sp. PPL193]MDY1547161.1 pyrroline-5-carboxylate reductase [Luteibacter sp. PPL193]
MNRIAFIGGGNMATALIAGMIRHGAQPGGIAVAEPRAEALQELSREYGVATYTDNLDAAEGAGILVLAVKPQKLAEVCLHLRPAVQKYRPVVISIAAGIRIAQIERWFDAALPVVRCMPNTPAMFGAGATGLYANARVSAPQRAQAQHVLDAAGLTVWVPDEDQIDVVTAVSGSGPAYFFLMVEALENAAFAQGMSRETARALAAQTAMGAGRMLVDSGETAATLRQRVTSPNGTTQAALESLQADHFPAIVARAVDAARRRGVELSELMESQS